ncbi:MAG: endo-1,4-beta-xylanase [Opitutales bacterium]|nr:endo-1,4-beta-xylanase [Opitutales bacterium]
MCPQLNASNESLKNAYEPFFLIGTSVNPENYKDSDCQSANLIKQNFSVITPENAMKWEHIHPKPGQYDFEEPDRLVDFATRNGIKVVGHTLVWHSQTPEWVFEDKNGNPLNREELLNRMRDHIMTVVGRYKGKVMGWDVVNEALEEDGSLRESPWLKIIGEDYIEKAFEYAHEADPNAELYYNDYRVEVPSKCGGALRIVKKLKAKGIRIDAVGVQGHSSLTGPSVKEQEDTIRAIYKAGVQAMITEMDIDVLPGSEGWGDADVQRREAQNPELNPYTENLPEEKQQELAQRYRDFFHMYLKNSEKITRVTLWGLNDKDSWLNFFPIPFRTNHPLLFDRNNHPKPAYFSVLQEGLLWKEKTED